MDDYISREAALFCFSDWIDRYGHEHTADEMVEYQKIENLPAADVRPVVRGEWKANPHIGYKRLDEDDEPVWGYITDFICTNCGKRSDKQTNFCPNCGADMREVKVDG